MVPSKGLIQVILRKGSGGLEIPGGFLSLLWKNHWSSSNLTFLLTLVTIWLFQGFFQAKFLEGFPSW